MSTLPSWEKLMEALMKACVKWTWPAPVRVGSELCSTRKAQEAEPERSLSGRELTVTDLTERLFQPAEVLDEAQLLGPAVGQRHQVVEQLIHLVIESGHLLQRLPLLFSGTYAAEPRQRGSALLLQLHQPAVF